MRDPLGSVPTAPPWARPAVDQAPAGAPDGLAADVAVVGAGLAGLSTAYHLRRANPDLRVVVLEAGRVASGASGLGTGLLGPRVGGDVAALRERFGSGRAAAAYEASVRAVDEVLRIVRDERIDCGLAVAPQLVVAETAADVARLRTEAAAYEALGQDVRHLGPAETARYADAGFLGALRFEPAATLDPLRLTLGLRDAARRAGAEVYEHSPVRALGPGLVELASGARVRAAQVVVAADALAGRLGVLPRRLVPLQVHAVATAPLDDEVLDALPWRRDVALIGAGRFAPYLRSTPDGRVVAGGGRVAATAAPAGGRAARRAWRWTERELRRRFPPLAAAPVANRWYGRTGFTLDGLPVTGAVPGRPGVWVCGGWCGHGLAMAVAGGALVAAMLEGATSDLPWARGSAPALPPDPLRRWALSAYLAAADLQERSRRRPGPAARRRRGTPVPTTRTRRSA